MQGPYALALSFLGREPNLPPLHDAPKPLFSPTILELRAGKTYLGSGTGQRSVPGHHKTLAPPRRDPPTNSSAPQLQCMTSHLPVVPLLVSMYQVKGLT